MKTRNKYLPKLLRINKSELNCKEIARYICSELDEHLDSPKCREIKKHIEACSSCHTYLDSMKKTVKLYRTYPNPKLSEKCRKEMFAKLKLIK